MNSLISTILYSLYFVFFPKDVFAQITNQYINEDGFVTYTIEHEDGFEEIVNMTPKNITKSYTDSFTVKFIFDQPLPVFRLFGDTLEIANFLSSHIPVIQINDSTYEFHPPEDTYDLMVTYYDSTLKYIFKNNINIISDTTLTFNRILAKNTITFYGLDENGIPLSQIYGSSYIYSIYIPGKLSAGYGFPNDHILVSDITEGVIISSQHFNSTIGSVDYIRSARFPVIKALYSDTILTNDPADYFVQSLQLNYPPPSTQRRIWRMATRRSSPLYGGLAGSGSGYIFNSTKWEGKLFINSEPDENYVHSARIKADVDGQYSKEYIEFPNYRLYNNQIGSYYGITPPPITYLSSYGDTLVYGNAPIFPNGIHLNNIEDNDQIAVYTKFYGPLNEIRYYDRFQSQLSIFDSFNNTLYNGILEEFDTLDVAPGKYRTNITNNYYWVNSTQGIGTLNAYYDLQNIDANPPILTSLRILNSLGKAKDNIWSNENAIIQFSAADFSTADTILTYGPAKFIKYRKIISDSTKLFIKKNNAVEWDEIPVMVVSEDSIPLDIDWVNLVKWRKEFRYFPAGIIYHAELDMIHDWQDIGLDLRIRIMDEAGNSLQWSLEPACFVLHRQSNIINNENAARIKSFALKQNYPNPFNPYTIINYEIPFDSNIELVLYDIKGQKIKTIYSGKKSAGAHSFTLYSDNLSSGIYLYRLKSNKINIIKKCLIIK